ncbi:MAG: SMC-Scp complex subunit ScpB [Bacteroidota bacterium]
MDQLAQHIESIVFVSESPISFKEIKGCLEETFETKFKKAALEKAIEELKEKYQAEHFSFEFLEIANGYQFLTKPAFHNSVGTLLRQNNKRRLSKAALETLSIIAYKQPVTKSEMEKIRGVSCDYSVQKLLEKELVAITGRSDAPGRPLLYGTSEKFMDYFGLKSLEDMPKPKDFKEPDNEIGEQAPIEETMADSPQEVAEITIDIPPTASSRQAEPFTSAPEDDIR